MPITKIMVLRHKAFIFKLKPDGAYCRKFSRSCGCARFVYNHGLAWNQKCREKDPTFKLLCVKRGYKDNADRVGAINILRVGQSRNVSVL